MKRKQANADFRWHPAAMEADENFRSMSDAEAGYLLRALNHAWENRGVPADPGERFRAIAGRRTRRAADKLWERVARCFEPAATDPSRLVNPIQEAQRLSNRVSGVSRRRALPEESWMQFLVQIESLFGASWFTAGVLAHKLRSSPERFSMPSSLAAADERRRAGGFERALGKYFGTRVGASAGHLRLDRRIDAHSKISEWRVLGGKSPTLLASGQAGLFEIKYRKTPQRRGMTG